MAKFRVGEYVTVTGRGPDWHGEVIARIDDTTYTVRVGGTSGASMLTDTVEERFLRKILPEPVKASPSDADPPPSARVIRRVYVALFKANTQDIQYWQTEKRAQAMAAALAKLARYVENRAPIVDNMHRVRCVFLAPEYMFAQPLWARDHSASTQRQLGALDTTLLRAFFAQQSRAFPNALLVPGTVAWRKPLVVASDADVIHAKAQAKGLSDEAYRDNYRRAKYVKRLTDAAVIHYPYAADTQYNTGEPLKTLVSPSAYKLPSTQIYSYGQKVEQLASATYIAKNTAHCYYNGACIAKYNKIGDFHEVLDGTATVHIPSPRAGRFTCGSVRFGISVCYDQSLWRYAESGSVMLQQTEEAVDFHILLSAHIDPVITSANLLADGHILSCSSKDGSNQVLTRAGTSLEPVAREKFSDIEMDVYRV